MSATKTKGNHPTMFSELGKGNAAAFLDAMSDNLKFTLIGNTKFSGVSRQAGIHNQSTRTARRGARRRLSSNRHLIGDGEYVAMQSRGKSTAKKRQSPPTYNTYCHVFASPTEK